MPPSQRPNILFIMTDQLRFDYLGAAGADFVRTPNIDRIAERGMRFTQCCSNAPICAPARIALATGLMAGRTGALTNVRFLSREQTTYYQRLRDDNYRVGCCGKLDLAKPDPWNSTGDRPCAFTFGFTHPVEIEGKMHSGNRPEPQGPYGLELQQHGLYDAYHADYAARARNRWVKNASHDSVLPAEWFQDTYIGRRSVAWLEGVGDDFPWHLFVSFAGPHDPFDPPAAYAERYRDAAVPAAIHDELAGKPACLRNKQRGLDDAEIAHTRRQYCASIEAIDDAVGDILDVLERRGMLENTYILFSADHGEMLGDHGLYTKNVMYEPSLRLPLLVAGPGIDGGRVSDAPVELIDVNPTICELAGLPAQEGIDARSFVGVCHGETDRHRDATVSELEHCRCVRTDRWKLIENYNEVTELYDLQADPQELDNVAADHPEQVAELRGIFRARILERQWRW
ncbi:MAG: sulfatase [Planctomycetota bacterium]